MKRIQHIFFLLGLFLSACGADQATNGQDVHLSGAPAEATLAEAAPEAAGVGIVTLAFRYWMPEAGEVFLVWGVDGWGTMAETIRPAGTILKGGVMHTPLARQGEWFTAQVQVPAGSTVEYGFLITKTSAGVVITPAFWEGNENLRFTGTGEEVIEVRSQISIGEATELPVQFSFLLYLLVGLGILGFAAFILMNLPSTRFGQKLTRFARGS